MKTLIYTAIVTLPLWVIAIGLFTGNIEIAITCV